MVTDRPRVPAKSVVVMVVAVATYIERGIVTPKRRGARSEFSRVEVLRYGESRLPGKRGGLPEIPIRGPERRDVIVRRGLALFVDTNLTREAGVFGDRSFIHQPFLEIWPGLV